MTEPSGGSTAAAPEETAQPVATAETTPQPLEPAPEPASVPTSDTPALPGNDSPANTPATEAPTASITPAASVAPAGQVTPAAPTPSLAPVEQASSTAPVALVAPVVPVAPVAPVAPAAPEPEPVPPSNVKNEPGNDSFAAATAALGNGLLESLQNAFKRPRTDDGDGDDGNQGSDAKRAKMEAAPEAEATPVAAVAPMMDLEAMLKSALGSMNTTMSPPLPPPAPAVTTSFAPAASTSPPLPASAAPVALIAPATPAALAAPAALNSPTPTPAPSTPSLPVASTTITSPPPPPPAVPITSPQTAWKMPAIATPTKEVASVRREVTSPTGDSSSAANHLVGASSRESKKMRFAQNPTYISRSMGLPLLGSYAVQLLYALSENPGLGPAHDGEATETELRRVYKALRSAFRNTRKLFSETAAILNTEDLDIKEAGDQETILMANMATISSSIFEADDIPLIEAHDYFLSTFLPDADALNKDLATLFLSLKYRTLAAELVRLPDDEQRGAFLERLFPVNLEEQLQNMHVETPLTEYEMEFMKDMMVAKERLLEAAKTGESRQQLQEQYTLDGFRDELSAYLRANEDVVLRYAESHGIEIPADDDANGDESDIAGDDVETSLLNGTDFAAMGDSIASMLSAAMASSDGLAAAPPPRSQKLAPLLAANSTVPMVIDSGNGLNDRPALEASPMAEGVSRLIQEAVQRSAARTTSQPPQATPATTQASTPALLATPSIRAHTTAPPTNGTTAAAPASTESVMDLTGLTNLIKEKLGQDAQNAQPPPPPAPALAPTPAYNLQQTQSPVAQANAALSSMQNTFANNLAMYNRAPAYPFQQVPPPPPPPPPQPQVNNMNGGNGSLPPNQSSPSAILYQQARQAAASKTQGHTRREGLHSTRRPWSPDEEQALMAGLDMVKGPHWSQILQLFGANGTISDILKDRSQVQLKDKARNLKLFFLKANTEMPYYLKCVTGELKTRAPSQAARKEAEERARATNKEEQARVQGIMTLAGGLQDNKNQVSAPPATGGGPAVHNGAVNGSGTVNGAPRPGGIAPNVATNGAARVGAPVTVQNIAPNQTASNLPPRIASATQLSPAVQQQLQQLQQRQLQQTQLPPRQTPGAATGTGAGAGAGVPQRAPVTAADVALAAARGGYSATAQALAAQQTNGSAAGRPLLASGTLPGSSLGLTGSSLPTTSASIKSVTAGITAGMTAAINNAINNAAFAARPTSTMLSAAQRLAAGRPTSTSPSRSPAPQQAQQQRPTQSSPSPIRNFAPQSPAAAQAARPAQASTLPGQQSPASLYSIPSPNAIVPSIKSPTTFAASSVASAHSTPQPQSQSSTPTPATAPTAATVVPTATPASTSTLTPAPAPAKALMTIPAPVPAAAAAPVPVSAPQAIGQTAPPAAPQQPEDRLWMLQQHIHTDASGAAPATATAPTNGAAKRTTSITSPTSTPAATTTPAAASTALAPAAAATATPAPVPTPPPVPVVKAPPPIPQHQQQLKQEQQEDASEESVLRRLLASPPN